MPDNPLIHVVFDILSTLTPRAQNGMIRFLSTWASTDSERRALLVKILVSDLTDGIVAEIAEMHRSTLLKKNSYRRLKSILPDSSRLPNGKIDGDEAILEAWYEQAG